jgi:hypothetical protein
VCREAGGEAGATAHSGSIDAPLDDSSAAAAAASEAKSADKKQRKWGMQANGSKQQQQQQQQEHDKASGQQQQDQQQQVPGSVAKMAAVMQEMFGLVYRYVVGGMLGWESLQAVPLKFFCKPLFVVGLCGSVHCPHPQATHSGVSFTSYPPASDHSLPSQCGPAQWFGSPPPTPDSRSTCSTPLPPPHSPAPAALP